MCCVESTRSILLGRICWIVRLHRIVQCYRHSAKNEEGRQLVKLVVHAKMCRRMPWRSDRCAASNHLELRNCIEFVWSSCCVESFSIIHYYIKLIWSPCCVKSSNFLFLHRIFTSQCCVELPEITLLRRILLSQYFTEWWRRETSWNTIKFDILGASPPAGMHNIYSQSGRKSKERYQIQPKLPMITVSRRKVA